MKLNGSEWQFAKSIVDTENYGFQLEPLDFERTESPVVYDHILRGEAPIPGSAADPLANSIFRARFSYDAAGLFDAKSQCHIVTFKHRVMRLRDFDPSTIKRSVKRNLRAFQVDSAAGLIFISLCDDFFTPWEVTLRAAVRCAGKQEAEAFYQASSCPASKGRADMVERIIQPKIQLLKMALPIDMPKSAAFEEPRAILTDYLEDFATGDFGFYLNTGWQKGFLEDLPPRIGKKRIKPVTPERREHPHLHFVK